MSISIISSTSPSSQERFSSPSGASRGPLVLTSISQTAPIDRGLSGLVFYRKSLKVLRKLNQGTAKSQGTTRWEIRLAEFEADIEPPTRKEINSFSRKSKSRLQHTVLNSSAEYKSQMTLTYDGDRCVINGKALKQDLNRFLVRLRRQYPGVSYIWILEFQRNGNPHFHVFTTIEYSEKDARILGRLWNVTVRGSAKHLRVHQYVPAHGYKRPVRKGERHGAFCPWEMGDGSYLTYKYLSKDNQKSVPPWFRNVGRFWGATRGVVKVVRGMLSDEFYTLFQDTVNTVTGEYITAQEHINRFFRDLRNYQEKRVTRARRKAYDLESKKVRGTRLVKKPRRFKSPIRRCCDATISKGVAFYEQWMRHYQAGFDVPF